MKVNKIGLTSLKIKMCRNFDVLVTVLVYSAIALSFFKDNVFVSV